MTCLAYVTSILRDKSIQPVVAEKDISDLLANDSVNAVKNLIALEMRRKDKLEFISLFGDEHVIGLLKQFLPVIYEPLYTIYSVADTPALLTSLFKLIKECIKIAEEANRLRQEGKITNQEISTNAITKYTDHLLVFEKEVYKYIRTMMIADGSSKILRDIVGWLVEFFQFDGSKTVDMKGLFSSLPPSEQNQVREELDMYIDFKAEKQNTLFGTEKKAKKVHPPLLAIPAYLGESFKFAIRNFLR